MTMEATPIRRIYDMPGHPHYGPVRRLWVMLEQIFSDRGGIAHVEIGIWGYQGAIGRAVIYWDRHLAWLLDQGLREGEAQRTVMQQMIIGAEFVR